MAGKASLWPTQGTSYADVLWSVLGRTGFVLPTLILLIAYLAIKYPDRVPGTASMKGREKVYSPPGALPILGHTLSAKKIMGSDPLTSFLELARRSPINSFSLSMFGIGRITYLNDPAYIQTIQSTNVGNFVKSRRLRSILKVLLGTDSILVTDGEEWHTQRARSGEKTSSIDEVRQAWRRT